MYNINTLRTRHHRQCLTIIQILKSEQLDTKQYMNNKMQTVVAKEVDDNTD